MRRLLVGLIIGAALVVAGCTAETRPATNVGQTTATLQAHVAWDQGQAGSFWFRYRKTDVSDWTETTHYSFNSMPNSGEADVTGSLTGLASSTTYEYQFCVQQTQPSPGGTACWNADGQSSVDHLSTFTTGTHPLTTYLTQDDSIAAALEAAQSGDTIRLAPGGYAGVTTDADFDQDVVVEPEQDDSYTVTGGWKFQPGAQHILVRGLIIGNPDFAAAGDKDGSAVLVDGDSTHTTDHITVEDSYIYEGKYGFKIASYSNTTPTNVTLRDSQITGDSANSGIRIDGVQVYGGQHVSIDHNVIHDIHTDLLDSNNQRYHDDGVQALTGDDVNITRNTIYDRTSQVENPPPPDQGIIVGRPSATPAQDIKNVQLYDNLVYRWPGAGIVVSGATNVTVAHNTSYDIHPAGDDQAGDGRSFVLSEAIGANDTVAIANNIFQRFYVKDQATNPLTITCTDNLIRTLEDIKNISCANTLSADPAFTSTPGYLGQPGPYYPSASSPAIDAANPAYPSAAGLGDRDMLTRPSPADIGAREWHPVTDTFDGTGGAPSSTIWAQNTSGAAELSSDTASAAAEGTVFSYTAKPALWDPPDSTYFAEAVLVYHGPDSTDYAGPVCRWGTGSTPNGYQARVRDGHVELVQYDNGAETIFADKPAVTLHPGESFKLGIRCGSPQKKVYLNGVSVIDTNDLNAVTSEGAPGIRGNTKTLRFDSFAAYDN
jgi:hypothetical protein